MLEWPDDLPQTVAASYQINARNGLLDKKEFINPTRIRTFPEWQGEFTLYVSMTQLASFRDFYQNVLGQTGSFVAPWLADLGFEHYGCRIVSAPKWKTSDALGVYKLTLNLELFASHNADGYYPALGGE